MIDRKLPLKKEISENIKNLMKKRGWTQLKLSAESGVSKSTLSDYLNCKSLINPGNVEKIATVFNVSKAKIDPSFSGSGISEGTYLSDVTKLPIVGRVSCGNGSLAYQDVEGYQETPNSWIKSGEYFYLKAKGDSMINAHINDGDLLLIHRQSDVENGQIAAVFIDGEAYLKRIYKQDGALVLQSENPNYSPIICTVGNCDNVRIIGKLVKSITEF